MQVINYILIAVISVIIGMFLMAWYDLDHPVTKEIIHEPVNIENNYYIKYDENYILMPRTPIPPKFPASQTLLKLE